MNYESRMRDKVRLLTRGHYVYAIGYYDGRSNKPYDSHFKDKCLKELYGLGFNAGLTDFNTRDKEAS